MSTFEDVPSPYEQLYNEQDSATIMHSDVDGIYVETESFEGTHRVWYSKHHGPRLKDCGLYYVGKVEIECEPPWIDDVRSHFEQEFGGEE